MSDSKNKPLNMRPHHALCSEFFRGKGYSEEFTENMANTLNFIDSRDSDILLTVGTDIICRRCPHNVCGVCETAEKVRRYDLAVLSLCGLAEGDTVKRSELKKLVREKIILCGKLSEVCGDCAWFGFCGEIMRESFAGLENLSRQ